MRFTCLLIVIPLFVLGAAAHGTDFLPQSKQTIVCLGDSITAMNQYGPMMQDIINNAFPERDILVINRGVSGDTARGALGRIEADVVAAKPDWVLINFGMNDQGNRSVEQFIADNEAMIDRIERDTKAKVVVVSPICNDYDRTPKVSKLDEYAAGLKAMAERRKLIYVPLTEESKRIKLALPVAIPMSPDCIHPNRIGYWVFTQTILKALDFPLSPEVINEDVPVNLLSGDKGLLKPGTIVHLDLPTPVNMRLVPSAIFAVTVRRATEPVVIDGKLDEWDRTAGIELTPAQGLIGYAMRYGKAPIHATAWVSWDDTGLNFAFNVSDSVVVNSDKVPFVVNRDCIEVCIDLRPTAERIKVLAIAFGGNTPRTGQYIISPAAGDMKVARCDMGNGPQGMLEGVRVASTLVPGGYQMELHVPKALMPDGGPSPDHEFGFDWQVIDIPASNAFHHAVSRRWTGSPFGWRITRDFGTLTLSKSGMVPLLSSLMSRFRQWPATE